MTKSERLQRASKMEAEAKALRREEKAFIDEADSRKEELLERWGMNNDELEEIAKLYGCSRTELIEYVRSEQQVNYYRRTHQ